LPYYDKDHGFIGCKMMKKYYCSKCKEFKNRLQLHKTNDTRVAYYVCRWCHNSNIYTTEDILKKMIENTLTDDELKNKHGSYL